MNVCECVISCKSGDQVIYRGVKKEDAEALYQHQCTIAQETYFTSLFPLSLLYNIEGKVERIKEIQNHPVHFQIVAINDGKIVGQAEVRVVKNHLKYKHRANIGISIDRDHWGMGIGSSLMKLALHQAKENGLEQMELGVYADNERAIHLYQKYGFEQCGIWKNAFKLKDGTYRDEILMSKIL